MRRRFSPGDGIVVATAAQTNNSGMVHRAVSDRPPRGWCLLMAEFAGIVAIDMICSLATGVTTVVADHTIADETGMIRRGQAGKPRTRLMADATFFHGSHMGQSFAPRQATIVTHRAGADGLAMIDGVGR